MRIERNAEMPIGHGKGRPPKYPWNELAVGDMLELTLGDVGSGHFEGARAAAAAWARNNGVKFRTSIVGDLLRVWRVA